jgi:hypothetical protein
MKALVYHGPGAKSWEEVRKPELLNAGCRMGTSRRIRCEHRSPWRTCHTAPRGVVDQRRHHHNGFGRHLFHADIP